MNDHLPKRLPMRSATETEYALVAKAMGVRPLATNLIMSNGVRVGTRENGQLYIAQHALDVAKKWANASESEDHPPESSQNEKTAPQAAPDKPKKTGRASITNYVLVDLENVQPKNLGLLQGHDFRVMVFVGANQTKLPFDLVSVLQAFGECAQYIKISGNGQNALDFHIAYYVGELCVKEPKGNFHIISKDTGFDRLIEHLKSRKFSIQRLRDLSEIPLLKISTAKSSEEKISAIVENLQSRGSSRPRKLTTLKNSVNSLFQKSLEPEDLENIVEKLIKRKYLVVSQPGNITYHLPTCSPNKAN